MMWVPVPPSVPGRLFGREEHLRAAKLLFPVERPDAPWEPLSVSRSPAPSVRRLLGKGKANIADGGCGAPWSGRRHAV